VPKGAEGVCKPSTWTPTDHRSLLQLDLYRAEVKDATEGQISELMAKGAIQMKRIATIDLPRRKEWLGW
jgi:branched-chain amino acid transport system substrate-binding protein